MPFRAPQRWLRSLICVIGLLLCVPAVAAFSVTGSGAADASPNLVEEEQVLQRLERAFKRSAAAIQNEYVDNKAREKRNRYRAATDDLARDFLAEAERRIHYLAADGILDAAEVSEDLGGLRDDYLGQLRQAYAAVRDDHAIPPTRRDYANQTDYVEAMLRYTFIERNAWDNWVLLLAAMAGGFLVAWLINLGLRKLAELARRRGPWKGQILEQASGPLYVAAITTGLYMASHWVWLPWVAETALHRSLQVIYALTLLWYLWSIAPSIGNGIAWLINRTYGRDIENHVTVVLSRILRALFLILFILFVINVLLKSDITGLLATLGVVGLALSFVLKGSIENMAASFTIFGDEPFRIGDLIQYRDEWGYVEDIGFRSTKVRTFDGHLINIPNAALIEEALQNVGARPFIRRRFRISLVYGTPPDKVREAVEILRDILKDHRGQPQEYPPHVAFEAYGDYDLRLLVQYYYQPADYWEAMEFATEVNLQILERFNASDIDFAFPTETVVLSSADNSTADLRIQTIEPDADPPLKRDTGRRTRP